MRYFLTEKAGKAVIALVVLVFAIGVSPAYSSPVAETMPHVECMGMDASCDDCCEPRQDMGCPSGMDCEIICGISTLTTVFLASLHGLDLPDMQTAKFMLEPLDAKTWQTGRIIPPPRG